MFLRQARYNYLWQYQNENYEKPGIQYQNFIINVRF